MPSAAVRLVRRLFLPAARKPSRERLASLETRPRDLVAVFAPLTLRVLTIGVDCRLVWSGRTSDYPGARGRERDVRHALALVRRGALALLLTIRLRLGVVALDHRCHPERSL